MNPTLEQKQIIESNVDGTLKVLAFAGTGKTSTFVEYSLHRPTIEMLYLAFNKSVEVEANRKFPTSVLCKTVHALAFRHVGCQYTVGFLKYFTVSKIYRLNTYESSMVCRTLEEWWNSAHDVIEDVHVPEDRLNLLGPGYQTHIIKLANRVWTDMLDERHELPMTHGGYLKLFQLSKPNLEVDTLLLDEAQDTNPVTLALVQHQATLGTKILLCGDPFQQIYSWRGAIDAMDAFVCPTLFLTQSFRFGKNVAGAANKLLSSFFDLPKEVSGLDNVEDQVVSALPSDEQKTIICRTNSYLFRRASGDQKIHVIGEEGFSQFLDVVNDIYKLYSGNRDQIQARQIKFFKSFDSLVEFAEQRLDDELKGKLNLVLEFRDNIPQRLAKIRANQTQPDKANIILTTGHKAKGLEWDNVELEEDFAELYNEKGELLPVSKDTLPKDEINLLYVALTRAKRKLKPNHNLRKLLGV